MGTVRGKKHVPLAKVKSADAKVFHKLHKFDVLCGRGNGINQREGNKMFRLDVERMKPKYTKVQRSEKQAIAKEIVNLVLERGGHFVRYKNPNTKEDDYLEISYPRAVEKTLQALREGSGHPEKTSTSNKVEAKTGSGKSSAKSAVKKAKKTKFKTERGKSSAKSAVKINGSSKAVVVKTSAKSSSARSSKSPSTTPDKSIVASIPLSAMKTTPGKSNALKSAAKARPIKKKKKHVRVKKDAPPRALAADAELMEIERMIMSPGEGAGLGQLTRRRSNGSNGNYDDGAINEADPIPGMDESTVSDNSPGSNGYDSGDHTDDEAHYNRLLKRQKPPHKMEEPPPVHRLMMESPADPEDQPEDHSGWFIDYMNGGSALSWERLFRSLISFRDFHGHCAVPPSSGLLVNYSEEERKHARLADWASVQRQMYRDVQSGRRVPTEEENARIRRLQALGFVWDYEEWHWETRFNELVDFQKKEEAQHREEASEASFDFSKCLGLALWVKQQRQIYLEGQQGKISPMREDRVKRLEGINFSFFKKPIASVALLVSPTVPPDSAAEKSNTVQNGKGPIQDLQVVCPVVSPASPSGTHSPKVASAPGKSLHNNPVTVSPKTPAQKTPPRINQAQTSIMPNNAEVGNPESKSSSKLALMSQ